MEDGAASLAFGHRAIPARQVDIEDETPGDLILTSEEARARGIRVPRRPDPTLLNPRPNKNMWKDRQAKRVKTGKDAIAEMLGFDEEEDEIDEDNEDDEDDERGSSRRTSRGNPFILTSCAVSRKRGHESDSD